MTDPPQQTATNEPRESWPRRRLRTFRVGVALFVIQFAVALFGWSPATRAAAEELQEAARASCAAVVPRWTAAVDRFAARSDGHSVVLGLLRDAVVALGLAAVWTACDRRRRHDLLAARVRVCLRYIVGIVMLVYGGMKIVPVQFQVPLAEQLLTPLGEGTPMGLLWAFVGSSPAYTVFGGLLEWIGGALLLWRRTTTLGALIVAGVMSNVTMLNFCYDVPVKRASALLWLAAVVLASRDARRLARVLLLDLPTASGAEPPFQGGTLLRRVRAVLKPMIVILALVGPIAAAVVLGAHARLPSPIDGVYAVQRFARGGKELELSSAPWHRLVLGDRGDAVVQRPDGSCQRYALTIDSAARTLALTHSSGTALRFRFEGTPANGLRLVGLDAPIEDVELRALDRKKVFRVLR